MLSEQQLTDLESAETDLVNKQLVLNTAVDIQVLLQLLVEKGVITREEVAEKRNVVRSTQKYRNAQVYIDQTLEEISRYKNDPKSLLQEIMRRKMQR